MSEIKKIEMRPPFVYLKQQGKTIEEIRKCFGVNQRTVSRAIKEFNETSKHKNRKGQGCKGTSTNVNSARKLTRRFQIPRTSIRRILKNVKKQKN